MCMEGKSYATAALVFGIISIPAAIIPLFGVPISILGIVCGAKGMKYSNGKAIAGLTCSILGLGLSLFNSFIGAYQASLGKNEFVNLVLE